MQQFVWSDGDIEIEKKCSRYKYVTITTHINLVERFRKQSTSKICFIHGAVIVGNGTIWINACSFSWAAAWNVFLQICSSIINSHWKILNQNFTIFPKDTGIRTSKIDSDSKLETFRYFIFHQKSTPNEEFPSNVTIFYTFRMNRDRARKW